MQRPPMARYNAEEKDDGKKEEEAPTPIKTTGVSDAKEMGRGLAQGMREAPAPIAMRARRPAQITIIFSTSSSSQARHQHIDFIVAGLLSHEPSSSCSKGTSTAPSTSRRPSFASTRPRPSSSTSRPDHYGPLRHPVCLSIARAPLPPSTLTDITYYRVDV